MIVLRLAVGGTDCARLRHVLRRGKCVLCLLVYALLICNARAADPQPYMVTIEPSASSEINDLLNSTSLLATLRESAPVPPFGLIARATGDVERLTTVLNSFGYYIPPLPSRSKDALWTTRCCRPFLTRFHKACRSMCRSRSRRDRSIACGASRSREPFRPRPKRALGLTPGAARGRRQCAAARERLLTALQEDGYALATVSEPIAYADDQAMVLDIEFRVETGPQVEIGESPSRGSSASTKALRTRPAALARRALRAKPDRNRTAGLLETGVFSTVTVRAAKQVSPDGRLALTLDVQERPLRAVTLSGAYSTDLGISLSASWTHRNLFGNAEQLILSAAGTGLWGDATEDVGYQFSARFIKPAFLRPDQTGELALSAVKQDLEAYRQTAETIGVSLRREFSPQWTGSVGLTVTHDNVAQQGVSHIYQLIALPVSATYDSTGLTNPLLDPTRGLRASLIATPTQSFGAQSQTFAILQASASTYFDLSGNGRSVLALRGIIGSVLGASTFDLPPDQRLYAGGSGTVRGFRYQSIGPLFPMAIRSAGPRSMRPRSSFASEYSPTGVLSPSSMQAKLATKAFPLRARFAWVPGTACATTRPSAW